MFLTFIKPAIQYTDAIITRTIRNVCDLKNEITLEEGELCNDVETDVDDEETDGTNVGKTDEIVDGTDVGTDVGDEENDEDKCWKNCWK